MGSSSAQDLLSFLGQLPTVEEQSIETLIIKEVETYNEQFQRSYKIELAENPLRFQTQMQQLQFARIHVSRSLQKSQEKRSIWNEAQVFINDWIINQAFLTMEFLVAINKFLTKNTANIEEEIGWRKVPIYTSRHEHSKAQDLPWIMHSLFAEIKRRQENPLYHPLQLAAYMRQAIISIHPFLEANGRTSQLFVDAFLLSKGYLPQSFASKMDALIVGLPEGKSYLTPHQAFKRVMNTIIHSYKIFCDRCAE